ncbi:hypothetical protein, partial [Actinophytocola sp.]|uniref:hypothetical protein n=1 Tax=Actinophytocola sp. TaxID=1872138 RepID=UPI002D494F44
MTSTTPTFFCARANAIHPVDIDDNGAWWCMLCGTAINCDECGETLHNQHECPPLIAPDPQQLVRIAELLDVLDGPARAAVV